MKLFTKYNRINLIATVIMFLLSSVAFAFLLQYVFIRQIDEDLKIEKNEIITYTKRNNHLPAVIEVHDQYTTYQLTKYSALDSYKIYTRKSYNADEHEKELQRTIEFNLHVNNNWYLVKVSKSLEGADDLIQTIITITVLIILLMLAVSFVINRIVLQKLWRPFYNALHLTTSFNLNNKEKLRFDDTKIDEFNYLNATLNKALSKAQNDYQSLKEFTENASHELQTPLAVIQSKLDNLIQNEKLGEDEGKNIQGAYDAVQNLKKLNQSLLLLAKIENNQFSEQTEINLGDFLQNKCSQFFELWKEMQVKVDLNIQPVIIYCNMQLIDILLNNILSNATKHNISNGSIQICLNSNLQVKNTGVGHSLNGEFLFKRFSKQSSGTENHGLGLSIIQQVCLASGYTCAYNFESPQLHIFQINFNDVPEFGR